MNFLKQSANPKEVCQCCGKKVPFIFDDITELEPCQKCWSYICRECNCNADKDDIENVLCPDCYQTGKVQPQQQIGGVPQMEKEESFQSTVDQPWLAPLDTK